LKLIYLVYAAAASFPLLFLFLAGDAAFSLGGCGL
jgi:hypothetical protein